MLSSQNTFPLIQASGKEFVTELFSYFLIFWQINGEDDQPDFYLFYYEVQLKLIVAEAASVEKACIGAFSFNFYMT